MLSNQMWNWTIGQVITPISSILLVLTIQQGERNAPPSRLWGPHRSPASPELSPSESKPNTFSATEGIPHSLIFALTAPSARWAQVQGPLCLPFCGISGKCPSHGSPHRWLLVARSHISPHLTIVRVRERPQKDSGVQTGDWGSEEVS